MWACPPNFAPGEVAEWSIAAVLKTVEGNTSGGSNPSLSASMNFKLYQGLVEPAFYEPFFNAYFWISLHIYLFRRNQNELVG